MLGYEKYSETAVPGTGLITGVIATSGSDAIAIRNGVIYTSTGTTWTSRATAATTPVGRARYDTFNFDGTQRTVIVDGVNDPAFWSSADQSVVYDTSAPADVTGATDVRIFKNHVFFAKGNLLNFTAPFAYTDYNTGNGAGAVNVGNAITGMIVFREQLIIFSQDRIQRLVGNTSSDFVLQPIAMDTGCISGDSIQEVGGDIMYLGPDGVRYLSATERNNDFGLSLASSKIQPTLTRVVNPSNIYTSCSIPSKAQYRLYVYENSLDKRFSKGFVATKISDQSVDDISWSESVGVKAYTVSAEQFFGLDVILFSSDTNYVYKLETGNSFDGEPIPVLFQTPFLPITDPRKRKTAYKHTLYCTTTGAFELSVGLKLDYSASGIIQPAEFQLTNVSGGASIYGNAIYGSATYGAPSQQIYTNTVVGSGGTIGLRYSNSSTNPPHTLDYGVLEYRENERR
jgi:hypothetical protein